MQQFTLLHTHTHTHAHTHTHTHTHSAIIGTQDALARMYNVDKTTSPLVLNNVTVATPTLNTFILEQSSTWNYFIVTFLSFISLCCIPFLPVKYLSNWELLMLWWAWQTERKAMAGKWLVNGTIGSLQLATLQPALLDKLASKLYKTALIVIKGNQGFCPLYTRMALIVPSLWTEFQCRV